MRPYPASFMSLAASRQNRNVPTTLVSRTAFTVERGVSREWFMEAMPALLIRWSSRPYFPRTSVKILFTARSSETSGHVVHVALHGPVDVATTAAHHLVAETGVVLDQGAADPLAG